MSSTAQAMPDVKAVSDPQIGQPTFAINFIARPDGPFRQALAQMQRGLAAELPAGVFTCPLDSLHLTVVPIIWARGAYDFDVRGWWDANEGRAIKELSGLVQQAEAFTLTFRGFDVLPSAIVARFEPHTVLNAMRDQIHHTSMFSDMLVEKIGFTHITVFRFETEVLLSDVTDVVQRRAAHETTWTIDHLTVCLEEIYPSLRCTDIAEFGLAG